MRKKLTRKFVVGVWAQFLVHARSLGRFSFAFARNTVLPWFCPPRSRTPVFPHHNNTANLPKSAAKFTHNTIPILEKTQPILQKQPYFLAYSYPYRASTVPYPYRTRTRTVPAPYLYRTRIGLGNLRHSMESGGFQLQTRGSCPQLLSMFAPPEAGLQCARISLVARPVITLGLGMVMDPTRILDNCKGS